MMRQAGRYLPEYREVRANVSFMQMCRTPELCAQVTVQPIDRLGVDAAILFSDILVVFDAMDIRVDFDPSPKIANPVRTLADLDKLRFGDPLVDCQYVMQAVQACKAALNERVPLIGFCGAPFTVISYLLEGGSSRDFEKTKALMFSHPAAFSHLMAKMSALLTRYLIGQIDAGANAVQIFDSWAGAVGTRDYEAHVLPHTKTIVESVKAQRPDIPVIVFARGNSNHLRATAEIPADVLGVDWSIELAHAIEIVGPHRVVQGNLDPCLLLAQPEILRERTLSMLRQGLGAKGHVANLGHGISRHTDPEMAQLFVDTVHSFRV
jgi:uroporphyrinogen decarboxylase